ncbi:MAG: hypothetical protein RIC24_14515 [Hyphomicrobiales bacterium]
MNGIDSVLRYSSYVMVEIDQWHIEHFRSQIRKLRRTPGESKTSKKQCAKHRVGTFSVEQQASCPIFLDAIKIAAMFKSAINAIG